MFESTMTAFVWGIVAGTFAFWATIYQDMKKRAYFEANFWKQEYRNFQDRVRQAIDTATTPSQKDCKNEDIKK